MSLVNAIPYPVGPVIPVDAVAIGTDFSTYCRARPIGRYAALSIESAGASLAGFILKVQNIAMLLNRALQRAVSVGIPDSVEI